MIKTIYGVHDNFSRIKARNYLVIPERKKLFVVLAENKDENEIVELCDGFLSDSTDCYVFVIFSRESGLSEIICSRYGTDSKIKPVTVSKRIGIYLQAADAVIAKSMTNGEKIANELYSGVTFFADSIMDIISQITHQRKKEGSI